MNILVCIKGVPDSSENEIELNFEGNDIDREDLVYSVNEWDNFAVEEAVRLKENLGGSVTVVTVGDEDDKEILRREMAMGADQGILISDSAFHAADGYAISAILKAEILKGKYDLVLTGVQADDGAGQVGGMLAAMLDWPFVSIVTRIEVIDEGTLRVAREMGGGNHEIHEVDLPAVLSIQTGINEPRYVGLRGIRKVASVEIPVHDNAYLMSSTDLGKNFKRKVDRLDYFIPETGQSAEILMGSPEKIIESLVEMLKVKGGIK